MHFIFVTQIRSQATEQNHIEFRHLYKHHHKNNGCIEREFNISRMPLIELLLVNRSDADDYRPKNCRTCSAKFYDIVYGWH